MKTTTVTSALLATASLVLLLLQTKGADGKSRAQLDLDEEAELGIPSFRDTPLVSTAREGQVAKLECSVNNLGTKKIIWKRKNATSPLTIDKKLFWQHDKRYKVQQRDKTSSWNLLIRDVRMDDAGEYECQVAAVNRQLRRFVELKVKRGKVKSKVEAKIDISGKTYVDEKHEIRLVCNASNNDQSPDDLDWFFEGTKLVTGEKIQITKSVSLMEKTIYSVLVVEDADMANAGMYVCRTSDLQVARERVDVLNAGTNNVKRGEKRLREIEKEIGKAEKGSSSASIKDQTPSGAGSNSASSCLSSVTSRSLLLLLTWLVCGLCRRHTLLLPT